MEKNTRQTKNDSRIAELCKTVVWQRMLLRFHARLAPDGTGRMSTTRYSYKIRYESRYYSVKVNFKFKSKFKLKFISKTQLQRQRQRYRERDIKRVIHT